jgi:NADH-quinone oxidoreductase subunit N
MLVELFLLAYILYILVMVAVLMERTSRETLARHTTLHLQIGFILALGMYIYQLVYTQPEIVANGYLIVNQFVTTFKALTLLCSLFILGATKQYMVDRDRSLPEYPLILSFATLFLMFLIGSNHLIVTFFALVGFSLNLYVLVLLDAPSAAAQEAGVKYYYLSTFSSGLVLYGIVLLFMSSGSAQFDEIVQQLGTNKELSSQMLVSGVTFLLIGFFFKLSAFPGHMWAPEVYDGAPNPIMGYFMLPVKVAVLVAVMQLLTVALKPAMVIWQPLVMLAVIGSLLWGCFGALYEKKVKRFLAYASINQMGFLLMGLACGTFEGYRATLLYVVLYAVMSVGFLVVFFNARRTRDKRSAEYLTDFRGLAQTNLRDSWALTVILLSMAGIPPLAGFFGKYYLMLHALEQGLYTMVIVGLITSLVSAYYYLRIIKTLWFETENPLIRAELTGTQTVLLRAVEATLWGLLLFLSPLFSVLSFSSPFIRKVRPLFLLAPVVPSTSFGAIACLAALGVVLLPNPVHSLLCLITAFLATIVLYLSVKAEFLAFIFLIVYVGAIAILFLFVIMLLNVKELTVTASKGRTGAFLVLLPLLLKLFQTLVVGFQQQIFQSQSTFEQLTYYITTQYQDIMLFTTLYAEHALLFILISLILLTAMIGAIVLASTTKNNDVSPTRVLCQTKHYLLPRSIRFIF